MVNVDIFSEGYDCPEVGFIQLARPTLSLSRYLIVKDDCNHSYRICGYMDGSVLVVGDVCGSYWQIHGDGSRGMEFSSLPAGLSRVIDMEGLGLRRVKKKDMLKK